MPESLQPEELRAPVEPGRASGFDDLGMPLRLLTVALVGSVALQLVDAEVELLGSRFQLTAFGRSYVVALFAAAALAFVLGRNGVTWSRRIGLWVYAANVGLFLVALGTDPLVAGLFAGWNLWLFVSRLRAWLARDRTTTGEIELAVAAFATCLVVLGTEALSAAGAVASAVCLSLLYAFVAQRATGMSRTVVLAGVAALAALGLAAAGVVWMSVGSACLSTFTSLVALLSSRPLVREVLASFYQHPSRLVVVTFAGLIGFGALLLSFPVAASGTEPLSPLDAFFTATSAVCVTGLVVVDTGSDLSFFGQAVVLVLIQLGALGLMVVSAVAMLSLGGRFGLRGERALASTLGSSSSQLAYRLARFVVLATLGAELLGALALLAVQVTVGSGLSEALPEALQESLWPSIFHAVSAFCNAGFALHSDSMVGATAVQLVVLGLLIVLGGLGFPVLLALWTRFREGRRHPLGVQVTTTLAVTAVLLVVGAVLFAVIEWNGALEGPALDRAGHAFFQSVSMRTAGFNSVPLEGLVPASVVFMMALMFIGASPISTGGGIKTTTVAVLLATLRRIVLGESQARLFRRAVPREVVDRSLAIVVLSLGVVLVALLALLLAEDLPLRVAAFETISAFATVGLSLGITPALGPVGKLVLICLMFVGRIGPITVVLMLGGRGRSRSGRLPESSLMVG